LRGRLDSDDGFDRKLIAPLVSGAVLNPINSTVVAVALVPIGVAFGEPPSATAWLVSALYLATAVGQPLVGRLIDEYGPRRLFLPATALVGVAGVIGAAAPNLAVLIVARVVLGLGTCAGYPAAMRLIRAEAERTGKDSPASVLTILAISTQTIAVIGPLLGGLLIDLGGWRTTLAINIPLSAVACVLGWRRFPKDEPIQGASNTGARKLDLDIIGVVFFAGALVALLLFLMNPHRGSWYLLVITGVGAAGFTARELHHQDPFIDLRVLGGNIPLLVTYCRALLAFAVTYSIMYGFPQWLEDGRGLTARDAGLVTLPMFATAIAVSAATGRREAPRQPRMDAHGGRIDHRHPAGTERHCPAECGVSTGQPRKPGCLRGPAAHLQLPRRNHLRRRAGLLLRPQGQHQWHAPPCAVPRHCQRRIPSHHCARPVADPKRHRLTIDRNHRVAPGPVIKPCW
jgi:MFS family permease